MKKTLYFLIAISLFSCDKDDTTTNGVPSYIQIDEITLDENYTTNITDAWVYIDGVNKGVYELPAHFPVLNDGDVEVRIYAGIKDNGIASQRVTYPFYHSYTSTVKLTIDSTTIISPTVVLKENIEGIIDNFDQSYNFNHDTCFSVPETEGPYGNYGSLSFLDSILVTEINYKNPLSFDNVPQQGSATYLELDYKSDSEFLVGMYINFPNTPTLQKDLLWINPKDDWNKIYVNLTQSVSEAIGAESFSVFIRMQRDNFSEVKTLDFDNIRIVHYKK
jgi:hypothetical protein